MLYLGADYGGYALKEALKRHLQKKKITFIDVGCFSKQPNDFTEFVPPVVRGVRRSPANRGVLVCKTGHGMAIGANRFRGIRAALVQSVPQARSAKTHDNANVLCLAAWVTPPQQATKIFDAWQATAFKPLPRRVRRLKAVDRWPR